MRGHAALLIAEGVHPKIIQERLDHSSIRVTLDTYGHLLPGVDEVAATAVDEAFRGSDIGQKSDTRPAVIGLED
jgi:integrase